MRKEGGLRTTGEYKKSYPGKPLISIVTVVRNAKKQLVRTLKSVIHQNYDNIEYIVIDGASTDGTVDVIREFEGVIGYWMSEKDSSVCEGMNKAIDLATKQICFLSDSSCMFLWQYEKSHPGWRKRSKSF